MAWAAFRTLRALATAPEERASAIVPLVPVCPVVQGEAIASAGVIFRGVAPETEALSEAVPGDSMDPTRVATAIVASPAWDLAVVASVAVAEASVGAVDSEEAVEAAGAVVGAGNEQNYRNTTAGAQI